MKLVNLFENYNMGGWVTPNGDYTDTGRHIHDILDNPEQFGLTKEFIDDVYARHGEEKYQNGWPVEGDAREELILLVLQRGWIRFRRYKNYWSVNIHSFDTKTRANLKKWVRTMQKQGIMHQYDELRIGDVKTDSMQRIDAEDLLKMRSTINEGFMGTSTAKFVSVSSQPVLPLLTEVNLSRVYNHFKGDAPVAIITAFRKDVLPEKNVANNHVLANKLNRAGMGYVWVDGAWIENKATDSEVHVSEVSILAIGKAGSDDKMFQTLVSAAKEFNQDGFIYKASGVDSPLKLFDKNGTEELSFNRVSMDTISDMYTRLRTGSHAGRSFVFEGERVPLGFVGKLLERKNANKNR